MRGFKLILWGIALGMLAAPLAIYLHQKFPEGWALFIAMLGTPGLVLGSVFKWPFLLVVFVAAFILILLLLAVPLQFIEKMLRPAAGAASYVSPAEKIVRLLTAQEDVLGGGAEMAKHLGNMQSVTRNDFTQEDHEDFYNEVAQWRNYTPVTVLHLKALDKIHWEKRTESILVESIRTAPFSWRIGLDCIKVIIGMCLFIGIPFGVSLAFVAQLAETSAKEAGGNLILTVVIIGFTVWLLGRASKLRQPDSSTEEPDGALEVADKLVSEFEGGTVAQFTQCPALIAYKRVKDKKMLRVSEIVVIALLKQGERA